MRMRLPWWGLLCVMAATATVYFLFDRMGKVELTMPFMASVVAFGLLLVVKWRLRRFVWFWAMMVVFGALHVAILCLVPWTKKWVPAATSTGIASLDIWAMLAVISIVGHLCDSEV